MQIEYTGRNIDITKALKEYVADKLGHAARSLDDVVGAHVILGVEKYRHIAEILVRRRRGSLTGQASSRDMYRSIQLAVERIETQMMRKREKLITRRRRGAAAKSDVTLAELEPLPVAMPHPDEVDAMPPLVVEEPPDRVKPITVEEAVLLLEESSRPFVVFHNSATGQLGVLYRRADGHYGIIGAKA